MATKKIQPQCVTLYPWLTANLGKHCLGALTGTDRRALDAAVMIVEAYSYNRTPENIHAFGFVVGHMQDSTKYLAFHCIAKVMNWEDRMVFWLSAGLLREVLAHAPLCAWEPGGTERPGAKLEGWT